MPRLLLRLRQQRNNVGFEAFGRPFSTRKGVTTGLNDFYGSRWKASAVLQARNKSGAVMPSSFNMPELAQSSLLALLPRTLRQPGLWLGPQSPPMRLRTACRPLSAGNIVSQFSNHGRRPFAAVPQPTEQHNDRLTHRALSNRFNQPLQYVPRQQQAPTQGYPEASPEAPHGRGNRVYIPEQGPGPSYRDHSGGAPLRSQQQQGNTRQPPFAKQTQPRQIASPQSELVTMEGTVKTITMENKVSGYIVARIKVIQGEVPPEKLQKGGLITAVATHKEMLLGQKLRLEGHWTKHKKYGNQLEVKNVIPFMMSETETATARILAAALPGVGPSTSARLADHFGDSFEQVMDSEGAVSGLTQVHKIGLKTALKIKKAWDGSRGQREAAAFLHTVGLSGKVVQRIVARHGDKTKAEVSKDPHYAMRNIKGMSLGLADNVAKRLAIEDFGQKPSRAAMAIVDMLLEASRQKGHTYMLWDQLQQSALHHLNSTGNFWQGTDLSGIAQMSASWGDIVCELGSPDFEFSVANAPPCSPAQIQQSLEQYLQQRLSGVGPYRAKLLVDRFGQDILEVLDLHDAAAQMASIPQFKASVAADVKASWVKSRNTTSAWVSPDPDSKLLPLAHRQHASKTQRLLVSVTKDNWCSAVRCYHPEMHAAEISVARELARLAGAAPLNVQPSKVDAWISINEEKTKVKLSEGQRQAIKVAMTSPILILTGGPGCGKTYATATIVKLWGAMHKNMKLAAPTGKASQRLQEVVELEPSSTVHRLLQYKAAGSQGEGDDEESLEGNYTFNRSNPLAADAVLVDEASMLDITLAAALLEALGPKTQLVLVGDVDQLPPVGPGTVLSAAIESKAIPVVDLREIFRQAHQSRIVKAAHSVQRGDFPALTNIPLDMLQGGFDQPAGTLDNQQREIYAEALESDAVWFQPPGQHDGNSLQNILVDALRRYVHARGFNLKRDVQVLSPMRMGTAGVQSMNQRLQALLNPPHMEIPQVDRYLSKQDLVFRLGDRVIQNINNYDREVYNGDSGFIVQVDPSNRNLSVEYPETDYTSIQNGNTTKIVEYKGSHFGELDMAWATTVHKAQGGESPVVVLLLSNSHNLLLTRRLLYTALTRAKNLVVVVGPKRAIQKAVQEAEGDKRLSTLKDRIQAQAVRMSLPWKAVQVYGAAAPTNPMDVTATSPVSEASKQGAKVQTPSAVTNSAGSVGAGGQFMQAPQKAVPVQAQQRASGKTSGVSNGANGALGRDRAGSSPRQRIVQASVRSPEVGLEAEGSGLANRSGNGALQRSEVGAHSGSPPQQALESPPAQSSTEALQPASTASDIASGAGSAKRNSLPGWSHVGSRGQRPQARRLAQMRNSRQRQGRPGLQDPEASARDARAVPDGSSRASLPETVHGGREPVIPSSKSEAHYSDQQWEADARTLEQSRQAGVAWEQSQFRASKGTGFGEPSEGRGYNQRG